MKRTTKEKKLAALLGLTEVHEEIQEARNNVNKFVPIPEETIQSFRAAQGLYYFLQAPALFSPKICKHCGEGFLVSRQFVGVCSYTCLKKSLEELGIQWIHDQDEDTFKAFIDRVYDGNEPLWVTDLPKLEQALSILRSTALQPESQ